MFSSPFSSRLASSLRAYSTAVKPRPAVASPTIPYNLTLSSSGNLPVYHKVSHQGLKVRTLIRLIDGDGNALLNELKSALKLKDKADIRYNHYTGQVIIKGKHKDEVEKYLVERFQGVFKKPRNRSVRNAKQDLLMARLKKEAKEKAVETEVKAEEKLKEQLM